MRMPSRKKLYWITLGIVMAVLLVYMVVLAFQDSAQTGEDPNLVGAIGGWAAIALLSVAFSWLIFGLSYILDRIFAMLSEIINR